MEKIIRYGYSFSELLKLLQHLVPVPTTPPNLLLLFLASIHFFFSRVELPLALKKRTRKPRNALGK